MGRRSPTRQRPRTTAFIPSPTCSRWLTSDTRWSKCRFSTATTSVAADVDTSRAPSLAHTKRPRLAARTVRAPSSRVKAGRIGLRTGLVHAYLAPASAEVPRRLERPHALDRHHRQRHSRGSKRRRADGSRRVLRSRGPAANCCMRMRSADSPTAAALVVGLHLGHLSRVSRKPQISFILPSMRDNRVRDSPATSSPNRTLAFEQPVPKAPSAPLWCARATGERCPRSLARPGYAMAVRGDANRTAGKHDNGIDLQYRIRLCASSGNLSFSRSDKSRCRSE